MSRINDYLDNLELDRQNIVKAVNRLGIPISENTKLAATPDCIDKIAEKRQKEYFSPDRICGTGGYGNGPGGYWWKFVKNIPLKELKATGYAYFFQDYPGTNLPKLQIINSSNTISIAGLFRRCKSPNVDSFTFENEKRTITNMESTYNSSLVKYPPYINTNKVTSFYNTFGGSTVVQLPNYDYSSATTLQFMCSGCSQLTTFPSSYLPLVTTLYGAFQSSGLTKLKNVNAPLATNLNNMCAYCSNLTQVINCNFPKTTYLDGAFLKCTNLNFVDISSIDLVNARIETGNYNGTFYNVPDNCEIIVNSEESVTKLQGLYPNLTNIKSKKSELTELEILYRTTLINIPYFTPQSIDVYCDSTNENQQGYIFEVTGPATIEDNVLYLNENAKDGDVITITVISTYNADIQDSISIPLIYKEKYIDVNMNNGQFVETEELINGNKVYQSDAGSYHINNGKSIATIDIGYYTKVVVYIKSDAESSYDYTEIFDLDTAPVRNKGVLSTKGKQGQWLRKEFNISSISTHTISVMYSKDSSGNIGTDRGYFYIAKEECE